MSGRELIPAPKLFDFFHFQIDNGDFFLYNIKLSERQCQFATVAQQVEQLTRNEQVVRSNRISSSTSRQILLVCRFFMRKNGFTFRAAAPLSQKVTLGSPVPLQARSRRLAFAASFSRLPACGAGISSYMNFYFTAFQLISILGFNRYSKVLTAKNKTLPASICISKA